MRRTDHIVDEFRRKLLETIAWCTPRGAIENPAGSLRSTELAPDEAAKDWGTRVDAVCTRRARLLSPSMKESLPSLNQLVGRLLVFDPGQSLSDAAAQVESAGFFNADNVPPWDTWIAYVKEGPQRKNSWTRFDFFLLCWIPPVFIELVQRSIAVNPEKCVQWAYQLDSPFIRSLRSAGFLF